MTIRSTTGKPGRNMADLPSSCRDIGQGSENFSSLGDQGRGTCSPVVSPALPAGVSPEAPVFSSSVLAGSDSCSASNPLTGSRQGDGSPAFSVASSAGESSGAAAAPVFFIAESDIPY
jgi:hypothetical protein